MSCSPDSAALSKVIATISALELPDDVRKFYEDLWQAVVEEPKFGNDEDSYVRAAVAEQGYGLDKLVHDDAVIVRDAVAKQGYGLSKP